MWVSGPFSEWLGIKTSLVLFSQLGMLGGMVLVLAHDATSMIAARSIIGIYASMCMAIVPVYNAEISPESMKKFYGSVLGFSARLGMLLSYTLGIWINYRWLAVFYMVMVVIMNIQLVFLPESPEWLRKKGHNVSADRAKKYFYNSPQATIPSFTNNLDHDYEIDPENHLPISSCHFSKESIPINSVSSSPYTNHFSNISFVFHNVSLSEKITSYFKWPVVRPLLVCCSLQIFRAFSGHQFLVAYSAHTLDDAVNINPKVAALFYPVFLIIGAILFMWTIQKVHWKRVLLVTTLSQVLVNAAMSLTLYLSTQISECKSTHNATCNILQFLPMPIIGLFGLTFSMGWDLLVHLYMVHSCIRTMLEYPRD